MYTILAILLFFLMSIFGVLLYFKSKKDRQALLDSGTCPVCQATTKTFTDPATKTTFAVDAIKQRVLKSHGCSGIVEIEYTCNNCGLKEVHTDVGRGCRV
jgi:C4-type Zn-finger protein